MYFKYDCILKRKELINMKYILLAVISALTLSLNAQDTPKRQGPPEPPPHKPLTEEQKKLRKELVEKYDANKDGKLDREEMQKISEEDRKKMRDAGIGRPPGPGGPKKDGPAPK